MSKKIPETLDEAVDQIISDNSKEAMDEFKLEPEDSPGARFHFFGGMNMRNAWGLWYNETPISKWFQFHGVLHGDDRSGIIFKALWCRLNNKPFDIDAEAAYYINYWKQKGCKADGSPL